MITSFPILFTSQTTEWHRLAEAIGLTPAFPPGHDWSEFDGDGILAVHHAVPGKERTELHFGVADLDATEKELLAADIVVKRGLLDDGRPKLTITSPSGRRLQITGDSRQTGESNMKLEPIWYEDNFAEPRRILQALGLELRLESDNGVWLQFDANGGGGIALHTAGESHSSHKARVELSFEYAGNLEDLLERVITAGFKAAIIDEAYTRALHIEDPDGRVLVINAEQNDLYGYRMVD